MEQRTPRHHVARRHGGCLNRKVTAANYRNNPFSLFYDGASTKNELGKVNIHLMSYVLMC